MEFYITNKSEGMFTLTLTRVVRRPFELSLSKPTTNTGLLGKAQDLGHRFLSFCRNNCPSLSGRNIFILGAVTLIAAYVFNKLFARSLTDDSGTKTATEAFPFNKSIQRLQEAIDQFETHNKSSENPNPEEALKNLIDNALQIIEGLLNEQNVQEHLDLHKPGTNRAMIFVNKLNQLKTDAADPNKSLTGVFSDTKELLLTVQLQLKTPVTGSTSEDTPE
jgi:hypothetical protein